MKVVCAWCGTPMGEKGILNEDRTSHGMCVECFTRSMQELYAKGIYAQTQSQEDFIEEILSDIKQAADPALHAVV